MPCYLSQAAELAPNVEIMGTLMYAAGMNFYYKLWVLQQAQKLDLKPNAKFLQNVENSLTFARRSMVDAVSTVCFGLHLFGHSLGTQQGNKLLHHSSANTHLQSAQLTEPLWTDLWPKRVELMHAI